MNPQQHQQQTMLSPDRTNGFPYGQVPFQGSHQTGMADASGQSPSRSPLDNNDLDIAALNMRLRTLGLHHSEESINRLSQYYPLGQSQPIYPDYRQQQHSTQPQQQQQAPEGPDSSDESPNLPPIAELHPHDSISMYRQAPRSRRDETNVDPGEDEIDQVDGYESYGTPGQETRRSPPPEDEYFEQMTMGPSQWNGTNVNNMQAMRDRLLSQQADPTLITTMARLEASEAQMRDLQATLIAERVARTQLEKQAQQRLDDVRDYRHELSGAVRALRRARDEGKKNEEERRRLVRAFEEAKHSLNEYNTALEVRKAKEQGRVQGREEAWAEAGRWMGHSPPIPVDPIQSVPETVLRHTPGQVHALGAAPPQQQHEPPRQPSVPPPAHYPNMGQQGQGQQQQQQGFPSNPMRPPPTQTSYFPDTSQMTNNGHPGQGGQYPQSQGFGQPMTGQMSHPGLPPPSQGQGQGQFQQQPMMQPTQNSDPNQSQRSRKTGPPPIGTPGQGQSRKEGHRRVQSLSVPAQSPDPGSYLDRVEHDPKLQSMLSGAPTRTVHTSAPVTGSSHTYTDKPLPDPRGRSKRVSRRQSLMDDLHNHRNPGNISSGDRYPSFPINGNGGGGGHGHGHGQGKGHSRQSSFNATRTGVNDMTSMGQPTPSSKLGQHRSKLAGALRNGADLDQLSSIDEEQHQQHASRQAQHAHQVQQAQAQRTMHAQQQQQQQFQQPPQQRGPGQGPELGHSQSQSKARYAPSMPPLRARPRPVMPVPLGKSGSEPQEPSNKLDMRQSMYPQPQSQSQGQGLAPPINMGDGQESALGLENMHIHPDQQRQGQGQGMKAPTIMIQPPSSRSNNKSDVRSGQQSYYQPPPPPHQPTTPHRIPLPISNQHAPTAYSASVFSPDQNQNLPGVNIVDFAAQHPFPDSRPTTMFANTIITEIDAQGPGGRVHARKQVNLGRPKNGNGHGNGGGGVDPQQIPLPASRAPTRARASTYAGTVHTIDEVTEEESTRR